MKIITYVYLYIKHIYLSTYTNFDIMGQTVSNAINKRLNQRLIEKMHKLLLQSKDSEVISLLEENKSDIVSKKILIDFNVAPYDKIGPIIFHAMTNKSTEVTSTLIDYGSDINYRVARSITPIFYACYMGLETVALKLLEKGADITIESDDDSNGNVLLMACDKQLWGFVTKFIEKYPNSPLITSRNKFAGNTPLLLALQRKDVALDPKLLDNPLILSTLHYRNKMDKPAIYYACRNKLEDIVLKLLEKFDDVKEEKHESDNNKTTFGHVFLWTCHFELNEVACKLLERKDIDINLRDEDDMTAILWACKNNMHDVCSKYLEKYPDSPTLAQFDKKKKITPLICLCYSGNDDLIVKYLGNPIVAKTINNRDADGHSPLWYCIGQDEQKCKPKAIDKLLSMKANWKEDLDKGILLHACIVAKAEKLALAILEVDIPLDILNKKCSDLSDNLPNDFINKDLTCLQCAMVNMNEGVASRIIDQYMENHAYYFLNFKFSDGHNITEMAKEFVMVNIISKIDEINKNIKEQLGADSLFYKKDE